jgi:hypothetical protein
MARTRGVVAMVQREMSDPSRGDSIAQCLGQRAAGDDPAGRHLRKQVAQLAFQVRHRRETFDYHTARHRTLSPNHGENQSPKS